MLFNKCITIELDDRYIKKSDLTKAVVDKLTSDGETCEFISADLITLNGKKYEVKEKNYANPVPVQQVQLVETN
ncbi:hypothetical protein [Clostridium intestinale]|uniref:DUF2922 domain-containing protein n=1 Tax=Clostridium intestinale TaxID=36845 RepID=A0A7D6VQ65_9CLOT|nr:hypothetical protein [Clostridium intestinale]QLY80276.1 hypothetical protein HZF06_01445 [Clostridium intestinale]